GVAGRGDHDDVLAQRVPDRVDRLLPRLLDAALGDVDHLRAVVDRPVDGLCDVVRLRYVTGGHGQDLRLRRDAEHVVVPATLAHDDAGHGGAVAVTVAQPVG